MKNMNEENTNKVFVSGATGFQGGAISNELMQQGYKVTTLSTQSAENVDNNPNLQVVIGNLDDKNSLAKALNGVTKAVYTFPLIFDMEKAIAYTNNFIDVAKEVGIELVVFNTSFHLPQENTGFLSLDVKVKITELFANSGLNIITLMPDIYMDNLVAPWMKPLIMNEGIIPYPLAKDKKVPWISQSDLGKAVAKALNTPNLIGQTLPIGGNLYTGDEIAQIISQKIDKEVNFIALTPDEFENQLVEGFGALSAKEISNLYRYVEENKSVLSAKNFEKTNELLGFKAQSLKDFIDTIQW